jgi:hypothetical protein
VALVGLKINMVEHMELLECCNGYQPTEVVPVELTINTVEHMDLLGYWDGYQSPEFLKSYEIFVGLSALLECWESYRSAESPNCDIPVELTINTVEHTDLLECWDGYQSPEFLKCYEIFVGLKRS